MTQPLGNLGCHGISAAKRRFGPSLLASVASLSGIVLCGLAEPAAAQEWPSRSEVPLTLSPFEGNIGKTYQDLTSDWQSPVTPPEDAPNVLIVLLDDVGFGQTATFGGLIDTPALDRLASEGLEYTRFHTTAICGPSRAALLTGRNHHVAGNGFLMEWATGFPSYSTMIPKDTATLAAVLTDNGYATSWYGKNHNTPDWETTVAGPFIAGRPASASSTFTASTRARPTNTTPSSSRTRRPSSPRPPPRTATTC